MPAKETVIIAIVKNLFSWIFLSAVGGLAFIILIFGLLIWLIERNYKDSQFKKGLRGIFGGFWWSAVTMTTVGYGDKVPKTSAGKLIGMIWMFMGLIIISGFTASIASSLTLNQLSPLIDKPSDIRKVKIATVKNSSGEIYLQNHHYQYVTYNSIEECLKALKNKNIGAVVYDRPILRYQIKNKISKKGVKLKIMDENLTKEYYGIAFPSKNKLLNEINIEILKVINQPQWQNFIYDFLGKSN